MYIHVNYYREPFLQACLVLANWNFLSKHALNFNKLSRRRDLYNWRCAYCPTIISASLSAELEPWRRFASSLFHSRRCFVPMCQRSMVRTVLHWYAWYYSRRMSIDFRIPKVGQERRRETFLEKTCLHLFLKLKLKKREDIRKWYYFRIYF